MALPRRVPLHVRDVGRTFAARRVCLTCERLLGECAGVYNGRVTLIEYEHQIPDRGASAVLGIWCSIPNSVTTEVDASHLKFVGLPSSLSRLRKGGPMAASAEYAPPKELVNVMVQSSEKLEGAASLLEMLEDKADSQRITASELAAVRCIVETCAANLGGVLEEA